MRLCFHQTGNPPDVLRLEDHPSRAPGPREVSVRMMFAPVHPADLNFIEGVYGKKPELPAVPGNEGCGRVEAAGAEVHSLVPGDFVIALQPGGCWSELVVADEQRWLKIDDALDPQQAAMLRINPATAWHLLHDFRSLKKGELVAQNAANSAVGRAVIQIARHLGLRTLNFVRRTDVGDELAALGADAVFPDDTDGLASAREFAEASPPRLALNAVGGDSALRLMDLLAPGSAHVTYGAMSRRSLKIPNSYLIFKDLEIRGCWITRKFESATKDEISTIIDSLVRLMHDGKLKLPVDSVFELADWRAAILRAQEGGRSGKVLLRLGPD